MLADSEKEDLHEAGPTMDDQDALSDHDRPASSSCDNVEWDAAAERRLVRKIDLLLMPLLTFSYGLQFYDKFVFSSAALFGMLSDLDLAVPVPGTTRLDTARYSTATAALYWGYLVGVLPMALLLQRFPIAKMLSLFIFLWGVIVLLTISVTSYRGAVTLRFFLGLVESSVSPGFVLVSARWYRKHELPLRIGIWYSAVGIFTVFSGVVNYAIGHIHGRLAPWKYMYILAGSVTILWALVLLVALPDTPATSARWFTPKERALMAERMRRDGESEERPSVMQVNWAQLWEALTDIRIWMMGAMGAAVYICNGGVTGFGSLIIKSFGYTSFHAILLQTPGGATTCLATWLVGYLASRYKNTRTLLIPLSCLPSLASALIIWLAPWSPRGIPLFGYYLLPMFGAPYVLVLALAAVNVRGETKKAIATGMVFVGYNVGNIIGPYLVNVREAPIKYRTTWISIIVAMAFTIVVSLVLRVMLVRENARRDRILDEKGVGAGAAAREGGDLTDVHDGTFRYNL